MDGIFEVKKIQQNGFCFCGKAQSFEKCCGPLLSGQAVAKTAEQLMRSRYCAAVLADEAYTLSTWHERTRPAQHQMSDGKLKWHRLKIKKIIQGAENDVSGEVIFDAIYKINGQAHVHAEHSRFLREGGAWFYLDALPMPEIG